MLFKYFKKVIGLTLTIYLIFSVFMVAYAENYEWTVINSTVETNSPAEGESSEPIAKDELNLDCESAILIEQNSRSSAIRKKCTWTTKTS